MLLLKYVGWTLIIPIIFCGANDLVLIEQVSEDALYSENIERLGPPAQSDQHTVVFAAKNKKFNDLVQVSTPTSELTDISNLLMSF